MNNDLTTLTHEELLELHGTLEWERVEAEDAGESMRVVNIEHELSRVRAQLAKVKPAAKDVQPPAEQPKLF